MLTSLNAKTALITGGGRGIGAAIARVMAGLGAHVVVSDIDDTAARQIANEIGDKAIALAGDVSREDQVDALVKAAEHWRPLDILVNNAGVAGERSGLIRQDPDEWQRVMDINVRGAYLMSRAVARGMRERRAGSIVNVASIAGMTGFPASHAYGVSKAALVMLTKTLAMELARHAIRVNAVAPGVIDAPMLQEMVGTGGQAGAVIARVPLGRLGTGEEIGNAVAFLSSDAASYITGTTLPVDGGWLAFGGVGDAFSADRNSQSGRRSDQSGEE